MFETCESIFNDDIIASLLLTVSLKKFRKYLVITVQKRAGKRFRITLYGPVGQRKTTI